MSDSDQGPTLIGSVQRALRLLDAVSSSSGPVPAKRLAREVGVALPTAYHLLRTLVHEGYLTKVSEGYVLGARFTRIHRPRAAVGDVAPALRELRDELAAACYLAVYDEGEIRLVDVADGPKTPRVDEWVAFSDAAHATAMGKSILASLGEGPRRDYLSRHPLADLTPRTITDRARLLRTLPGGDQLAIDRGEFSVGTSCVAAAVRTATLTGAIAVSVPSKRLASTLRSRQRILAAAERASRVLALA